MTKQMSERTFWNKLKALKGKFKIIQGGLIRQRAKPNACPVVMVAETVLKTPRKEWCANDDYGVVAEAVNLDGTFAYAVADAADYPLHELRNEMIKVRKKLCRILELKERE